MLGKNRNAFRFCQVLVAAAALQVWGQTWTWTGCPTVTSADFKVTRILQRNLAPDAQISEPVKMDFDMDAAGMVDIYYAELRGKLKRYQGATGSVQTLATLEVWKGPYGQGQTDMEEGLFGVVLDPKFKVNRFIYLMYAPPSPSVYRVSRWTLAGNALGSEKVVVEIPAQREDCCHTGGGMAFDAYGDLWIAVGNNTGRRGNPVSMDETRQFNSDEWGASSTAGMRGGIIRIHPDDSPKGYSIPAGNFGDYFAKRALASGDAALAAQYRDTSKVLPEIFVKGTRNAYTLSLDPVRRWVLWGDVGPDNAGARTEENNLAKVPGFYGWPYFAGANLPYVGNKDAAAPTNSSKWNKGLTVLPPAIPAINPYVKACAITGPLYRYDGDLKSTVKLPPHFTRKWFATDWSKNKLVVMTLDDNGNSVTRIDTIALPANSIINPTDLKIGPDGALYIINYAGLFETGPNTGISRIEYTGTCRPDSPRLETPESIFPLARGGQGGMGGMLVNPTLERVVRLPGAAAGFRLFDLQGRLVWELAGLRGGASYRLPELPGGILHLRWIQAYL